nr:hypothetical protein [Thermoanaerobaculia bacterium]
MATRPSAGPLRFLLLASGAAALALPFALRLPAGEEPPTVATRAEAEERSEGCLSCHAGIEPIHASGTVRLACVDCHGGNASAAAPPG